MRRSTLLGATFALLIATGCSGGPFGGSGQLVTEDREVGGFESVELRGSGELTISLGGEPSVTVEADSEVIDRVTTRVEGGTLILDVEDTLLFGVGRIVFEVTMPRLAGIELTGSGSIEVDELTDELDVVLDGSGDIELAGTIGSLAVDLDGSGRVDASALTAETVSLLGGGSGDMDVNVDGDLLTASVDGSMNITARGSVVRAEVILDGSGTFAGRDLTAAEAVVEIPGSGAVEISVDEQLEVAISGSGDVTYYGSPELTSDISGSGSVDQG